MKQYHVGDIVSFREYTILDFWVMKEGTVSYIIKEDDDNYYYKKFHEPGTLVISCESSTYLLDPITLSIVG